MRRNGSTRRWRQLRAAIISKSTHCGICQLPFQPGDRIHVDHIVPLAFGGRDDPRNLRAVHARCNLKRGAKPAELYARWL